MPNQVVTLAWLPFWGPACDVIDFWTAHRRDGCLAECREREKSINRFTSILIAEVVGVKDTLL